MDNSYRRTVRFAIEHHLQDLHVHMVVQEYSSEEISPLNTKRGAEQQEVFRILDTIELSSVTHSDLSVIPTHMGDILQSSSVAKTCENE